MDQPKVIKRYANRKLYDTERSCYVTLDEIAQMVKDGEDVQVIDNKSKDDLTAVTLAQIIVEEQKKVAKMPLKLLKTIIQSGNEAIGDFYQKRVVDPVAQIRDDVEKRVEGIFKPKKDEDGKEDEEATSRPTLAFVSATTEAIEVWQRKVDERVREALSAMTHLSHVGTDVEALRHEIAELDERLKAHEANR